MPREKSWHWDHFHKTTNKVNSTHYGAKCKYCTAENLRILEAAEAEQHSQGLIPAMRSRETLMLAGEC